MQALLFVLDPNCYTHDLEFPTLSTSSFAKPPITPNYVGQHRRGILHRNIGSPRKTSPPFTNNGYLITA